MVGYFINGPHVSSSSRLPSTELRNCSSKEDMLCGQASTPANNLSPTLWEAVAKQISCHILLFPLLFCFTSPFSSDALQLWFPGKVSILHPCLSFIFRESGPKHLQQPSSFEIINKMSIVNINIMLNRNDNNLHGNAR